MLANAESKLHVVEFGFAWGALGHDFQIKIVNDAIVARLNQQAASNCLGRNAFGARVRQSTCYQKTQVLLGRNDSLCAFGRVWCDDDFGENLDDFFGCSLIKCFIKRNNTAEG